MISKNNKKGLHPQKTPIWASICIPEAPNLLISPGRNPRLGGTVFVWGGTSSQLGGHGPGMPPRGAGSARRTLFVTVLPALKTPSSLPILL